MRRSKFEIYADILRIAKVPQRKTHLVYKANLNFRILKKYINGLTEKGFLCIEGDYYVTTNEGEEFLEAYDRMYTQLSGLNEIEALVEG